jgi:Bacterial PH domain
VPSAPTRDPPTSEGTIATWPPRRSAGGDAALPVGCALLALAVLGAALALVGLAPGPAMLGAAVAAAVLALAGAGLVLWGLAYRQLAYVLGDAALEVRWLGERVLIPYGAIEAIYTGQRLADQTAPSGLRWPGINVGSGHSRGLGRLQFYATSTDPAALTLVAVDGATVVLSAAEPQPFRSALIAHVRDVDGDTGPGAAAAAGPQAGVLVPARAAPWSALRDRWFPLALGVALVLLLATLAAISLNYGALPALIPTRFDSGGRPTAMGPPTDLLRLPLGGLVVLLANIALGVWAHPRQRVAARLVWVGAALVQAILLIAAVRLVQ